MAIQDIADVEDALVSSDLKVRHLYELWEMRQPVPESGATDSGKSRFLNRQISWLQNSLALPLQFMEKALKHEEFLLACDVARETLWYWKEDGTDNLIPLVKVRMSYASALTRLGYTHKARAELERYAGEQYYRRLGRQQKVAILLQLGEIMREESQQATTKAVRLRTAEKARQFYSRALAIDPARLDALTLTACASLVAAEPGSDVRKAALDKAREIVSLAKVLADSEGPNWKTTWARAAAHTVLGEIDEAAEQYGQLQSLEDVTTELLADIRYKTRFLAEALGEHPDLFKSKFPPLQLIVFAGHVLDLPGRSVRFPYESVERVREMLRAELEKVSARVGMVSAAAGADLLFIEALRQRKGATFHLVLPWARDEFRRNSVRKFEPAGMAPVWEPLFDKALAEAATIREMGAADTPSSNETWQYAMEVTAGLALHTARVSRLDIQPLVLWDKQPGWKPGGTASFVGFWRQHLRQEPQIILLPALERSDGPPASDGPGRRSENSTMQQEVKSMLFADIEGYSKLSEKVIPAFVETFMQRVALLIATSKHAPRCMNTWGDAIYAVFDFARDAGSFAIELVQMIQEGEKDWLKQELYWEEPRSDGGEPKKHLLNIRIGLHTGPVFKHFDPVIRQIGFTGAHVSRAARIEPVAKPGEVFASEEFVAMAALDAEMQRRQAGGPHPQSDSLPFVCEYAGSMQLAKGYPGRYRVYRVLPKPVLAVEELARAAHESYCAECAARGETPETNPSYRPWEELPEDLRKANRGQVEDIPEKLAVIGYELAPSGGLPPSKIVVTDADVELLAIREHDRWMKERLRQGWTPGPKTNRPLKIHEDLVDWDQLSEPAKEKDRDVVRNLTILLERAGLRVRKPVDRDGDTPAR